MRLLETYRELPCHEMKKAFAEAKQKEFNQTLDLLSLYEKKVPDKIYSKLVDRLEELKAVTDEAKKEETKC